MINTTAFVAIVSILSAVFILAMKICFASKCEDFSVCYGLITVHREVELENAQYKNDSPRIDAPKLSLTTQTKNVLDKDILQDAGPEVQV